MNSLAGWETVVQSLDAPYQDYLRLGRAWSPLWTSDRRGFDCWLVFAPPGGEVLESAVDYRILLARRLEHQLEKWLENHADELPVVVDYDNELAVRSASIAMMQQYLGMELNPKQPNRQLTQLITTKLEIPNLSDRNFPVPLLPRSEDEDFGVCLDESTLKGWLIEVR